MKGLASTTVTFTETMQLTMKKAQFSSNTENKQRFINMLSAKLVESNCRTHQASEDVDLLIVKKAVESAYTVDTVLIGDDTDLLILLIYHARVDSCALYLSPSLDLVPLGRKAVVSLYRNLNEDSLNPPSPLFWQKHKGEKRKLS